MSDEHKQSPETQTEVGEGRGMRLGIWGIGLALVALVAVGLMTVMPQMGVEEAVAATKEDVAANPEFGRPGDMVLGDPDAPVEFIEYASMTCSHCASFKLNQFPAIKEKFIDTGLVKYTMREMPVGPPELRALSATAFMVARCLGDTPEDYYKAVGMLFKAQSKWAYGGTIREANEKLQSLSRQIGLTEERYRECTTDQTEYERILAVAKQGVEVFDVTGTPTLMFNGGKYEGKRDTESFVAHINSLLPADKRVE